MESNYESLSFNDDYKTFYKMRKTNIKKNSIAKVKKRTLLL